MEDVLRAGQAIQRDKESNQISLFGGENGVPSIPTRAANLPEWPVNQKLGLEREALGFYISGHPLQKYHRALKKLGVVSTLEVKKRGNESGIKAAGVVTALRLRNTKKGDRYASLILEDWLGTLDVIVWPDVYARVSHLLVADDPVLATGKADVTDERCVFIVENLESLIEIRDKRATQGILVLSAEDRVDEKVSKELCSIFSNHPGKCPVRMRGPLFGEERVITLRDQDKRAICVNPSEELCDEIEQLFGHPVLSFI